MVNRIISLILGLFKGSQRDKDCCRTSDHGNSTPGGESEERLEDATVEEIEMLLLKNRENQELWQERAQKAVEQQMQELAAPALQRKQQYVAAAAELELILSRRKTSEGAESELGSGG